MSFIAADEFIILMDFPGLLSPDNLLRIRELGVRTLYAYVSWQQVERRPGVYDWETVEAWLARAAACDMQVLLRCYEQAPVWCPDDWYLRTADGGLWRERPAWGGPRTLLSPWCAEAMQAEAAFLRACQAHCSGARVLCYPGVVHDGEMLLPGHVASYYDPHARNSYRDYVGDGQPSDLPTYASMNANRSTVNWLAESLTAYVAAQQAVFPEIWLSLVERDTPFAEAVECGPRSGNWLMRQLCADLPAALGKDLNVLIFEVYREGGMQGALRNVQGFEGCTWVGSQFCEGLRANTDDAIARGLRGFITAPVYPDGGQAWFEPWKLEALRWSLAQWRQAAEGQR